MTPLVIAIVLVTACGSPPSSVPPSGAASRSPAAPPSASIALGSSLPSPRSSTRPIGTPTPTVAPSERGRSSLPIRGDALPVGLRIPMTPGPDGSVFVGIPGDRGAVIVRLDRSGRPMPGWPIRVPNASVCDRLVSMDDGGVRAICDTPDLPGYEWSPSDERIHAFDRKGRALTGWPIVVRPVSATRSMPAGTLRVVHNEPTTDVITPDVPSHEAWMTEITETGTARRGTDVPLLDSCCPGWTISSAGVAYTVAVVDGSNRVISLDLGGSRVLPTAFDGRASQPSILPSGEVAVLVGRRAGASQLLVVDPIGGGWRGVDVPMTVLGSDDGVDCDIWSLYAPVVSPGGVSFIRSDLDDAVAAFDARLQALRGWPVDGIRPQAVNPDRHVDGLSCATSTTPVAHVGDVLVVPVDGGGLSAFGRTGRVERGWPVRLTREGAEFWAVAADQDGLVYALAIEPEGQKRASATIVAIEPDSTVRYATTILEP